MRRWAAAGEICATPMDEYKEHLRRLAVHDAAFLEAIAVEGSSYDASVIDKRTAALMRVAATVAIDAALASFQHTVPSPSQPGRRATRSSPASRR